MKKSIIILSVLTFSVISSFAQDSTTTSTVKKGWKFGGGLPAIAFNSDEGFKYGALCNVYDYGDGTYYPNYKRAIYAEWSRTTKGSGINRIYYDDKKFLNKDLRFYADFNYLTERILDFYGFNGYNALYNTDFEDTISKGYYKIERKMLQFYCDLRGKIGTSGLKWYGGYIFQNQKLDIPDVDKLNKGKDEEDKFPEVNLSNSLYLQYIQSGLIEEDEADGGTNHQFIGGLIFDTRDNEACPAHGMWNEIMLIGATSFKNDNKSYTALNASIRQYFGICNDKLIFTYRAQYFTTLSGNIPFYMLPFSYDSNCIYNALGANKNLRGIRRNRIVGQGYVYGNFETRWKFFKTKIAGQDLYLALAGFADAGRVTKYYKHDLMKSLGNIEDDENFHPTAGLGFHIAFNNNFVVSIDHGRSLDSRDGEAGTYINIGWLW